MRVCGSRAFVRTIQNEKPAPRDTPFQGYSYITIENKNNAPTRSLMALKTVLLVNILRGNERMVIISGYI